MLSDSNLPLKITDDDLDRAVVGHIPVSRPHLSQPAGTSPAPHRNWNGVAISSVIAAFIATVVAGLSACLVEEIAGIAAFGAFAGLVTIVLACAALARTSRPQLRGSGLAILGVVAGVAGVIGWALLWSVFGMPAGIPSDIVAFEPEPLAARESARPTAAGHESQRIDRGSHRLEGVGWAHGRLGGDSADRRRQSLCRHEPPRCRSRFCGGIRRQGTRKSCGRTFQDLLVGQAAQPAAVEWVAPEGIDLAIAVVDVQSDDPQSADWVADTAAKLGDEVFAIGNPHGLGWTHTSGAISQFRQQNLHGRTVQVIQTNTAINPGNSGGGLYDKQGRLVGITTWTQDKRIAEGLSFAIAFETLLKLNPEILNLGAGEAP